MLCAASCLLVFSNIGIIIKVRRGKHNSFHEICHRKLYSRLTDSIKETDKLIDSPIHLYARLRHV